MLYSINSVFYHVLHTAGKGFKFAAADEQHEQQEPSAAQAPDREDANANGMDWGKLAGKRYRRSLGFAGDLAKQRNIIITAIILEPLRYLHLYFMKIGHSLPDNRRAPALIEEIWEQSRLVHAVLQYYSAVLLGRSPRLILIWM